MSNTNNLIMEHQSSRTCQFCHGDVNHCYCCQECGQEVWEHKEGCKSDPNRNLMSNNDTQEEVCSHIGYPFGEPPLSRCVLPKGHKEDHVHVFEGELFNEAEILLNRRKIGLDA